MAHNRVQEKYSCAAHTQELCRKEYLSKHKDLKYVRVPSDGNCFFRAIAAYYRRTGDRLDHVSPDVVNPIRYHQLRRYIVDELGKQIRADPIMESTLEGMYNDPKNPHRYNKMKINGEISIEKILSTLAKKCKWNIPAFEMMVERVPIILNINLILYKVVGDSSQYYVTKSVHTPYDGAPVATTISIFLESNHYGLIFPAKDSRNAKNESFDEGENDSDNDNDDDDDDNDDDDDDDDDDATAALIAEMLEQNERNAQNAKKASRKKGKAPVQKSSKASHNSIAELERKLEVAKAKKAAKARAKAPRNNNLNAALAESLGAVSLNNGLNNDMRAALEASFQNLSFSSRNNRNKLLQQHALNRSMRRNSNSNSNVPLNSVEFKKLTVATLKSELERMGVPFGSKNLKASLYQKYKKATRKKK